MANLLMYALFLTGLILIIKGGDWFVDSASYIAETAGVPKFAIGATIVSVATTLPEIIVSVTATVKGNVDMAAGNAIGSVTANTAMIMGLFIVCLPFAIKRKSFAPKAFMMLGAAAALVAGCIITEKQPLTFEGETNMYYSLSGIGVAVLICIFIAFFTENFISMKNNSVQPEPNPYTIGLQLNDGTSPAVNTSERVKNILCFVLGAAGIITGAQLLVSYGTRIAESLNVPQRIISVIAIAIGTSLPELVTTVTAIRKKAGALSVGNILGANIIDLVLILPICSFISIGRGTGALAVSASSVETDMAACLAAIIIAVIPTVITKRFKRWQGIVLLAGYAGYVLYTVLCRP